jgi:hypothetical protein
MHILSVNVIELMNMNLIQLIILQCRKYSKNAAAIGCITNRETEDKPNPAKNMVKDHCIADIPC